MVFFPHTAHSPMYLPVRMLFFSFYLSCSKYKLLELNLQLFVSGGVQHARMSFGYFYLYLSFLFIVPVCSGWTDSLRILLHLLVVDFSRLFTSIYIYILFLGCQFSSNYVEWWLIF
jgi:hypothetical protein